MQERLVVAELRAEGKERAEKRAEDAVAVAQASTAAAKDESG